jgi:multidrug efflux pump subunit AcrA (membrane-fusion protein)
MQLVAEQHHPGETAEARDVRFSDNSRKADAVQTIGNQQYVFAATENPSEFILRPVRLGPESNGFYPVLVGINTGDRIVTQRSFLLRAEWLKLHPSNS